MKFLVLFLFSLQFSYAQMSTPPLPTEGSEAVPEVVKPVNSPVEKTVDAAKEVPAEKKDENKTLSSRENRADSLGSVMVGYQLITSWLPSKFTFGYTHIFNEKWSLEGEYSRASISSGVGVLDFGEVKETRYTLQARRYVGNSFNFTFGPVVSAFSAELGSDVLDSFGNEISSNFSAQNIGISGGIGNRWQWNNGFTLGIDWLRINIPVAELKVEDNVLDDISDTEDQDDVKEVIRTFNRIPTFVFLGVNLGYTF